MTKISIKRWAGALTAAAALLAGCGGGESSEVATTAKTDAITAVEGRMLPETAVQDVSPVKSRSVTAAPKAARVSLGELSMAKVEMSAPGTPRLVGQARDVQATKSAAAMQSLWQWKNTAVGGKVAAISFNAEGAYGLRLGVLVKQLPGSATVRVYTQSAPDKVFQISGQAILQLIERNQAAGDQSDAARTWWTPDTGEGEATLEVELPPGVAASALDIAVPQLSHIFENLSLPTAQEYQEQVEAAKINESASCNLDATCYSNNAQERNSVARMLFTQGGGSYLCTGTLMNDTQTSFKPYFLTANHCFSTQTVASTLETRWFYRSPTCNSGTLQASSVRRTGGAQLLYASGNTDTAFMLLNDTPPTGVWFAGWSANTVASGTSVVGLHHPSGDLLKISFGTINGQSNCQPTTGGGFQCSGTSGNYYRVTWSQGTTEGGSSGSAIFRDGYVVGTLYGGGATCTNRSASDFYGRFDVAFNAAIKTWLNPATTPAPTPAGGRAAVYRFYNTITGTHFFTVSAAERDFIIRTYPQFNYENVAFYAYADAANGRSPIFRFYNNATGTHFFSASVAERDFVIATYPQFQYENISWYGQATSGSGTSPIYRFYNPTSGAHFYTISAAERDFVIQTYKDFQYEGPMYYAWTTAQ
ncbi:trypsin-like peptidase domain-containing protein [Acidovorax sp. IB03]|uniref:trypsin-like peptidase domain-containing protein n=1 Tax=Acidovorax sp. IB03 TaxID=2779366 RepID=UPI0018E89F34|nr:trypsin-like peptidase domain-containing protein [Acidovorax sp. IB03]MBJ2162654.1 trypsin-like peptidase domain-containing protein [Acidovorax sp. IB03]